ncbi:hypothetical protein ACFQ0T_36115 [Kitasatospora gansuensis]
MNPLLRTAVLAAVASGLLVTPAAAAPEVPHEGGLVGRIDNPGPVRAMKQEAVEFFWYDCGHSQQLEIPLERWAEKHRSDVTLRRVPRSGRAAARRRPSAGTPGCTTRWSSSARWTGCSSRCSARCASGRPTSPPRRPPPPGR